MENVIKKQTLIPNSTPARDTHRDSHTISKVTVKPKIRIIHLFAPEIIKTDVANFRELVQRLTGKPTSPPPPPRHHRHRQKSSCRIRKPAITRTRTEEPSKKMEPRDRVKAEEAMMWNDETSGGYLGGFADLDGFIEELGGEFPLLPLVDNSHMHGFENSHPTSQANPTLI